MVKLIIIPTKWLFHWGYTPFSDIPMSWYLIVIRWYHTPLPWKWTCQEWMFHDVPGSPEISPLVSPTHQAAGDVVALGYADTLALEKFGLDFHREFTIKWWGDQPFKSLGDQNLQRASSNVFYEVPSTQFTKNMLTISLPNELSQPLKFRCAFHQECSWTWLSFGLSLLPPCTMYHE